MDVSHTMGIDVMEKAHHHRSRQKVVAWNIVLRTNTSVIVAGRIRLKRFAIAPQLSVGTRYSTLTRKGFDKFVEKSTEIQHLGSGNQCYDPRVTVDSYDHHTAAPSQYEP